MKQKKCFVISPIGDKDSDVRKHADSFLKLLVEPALSSFNFDIIRADQIATSSVITNDIVEFVQQSELCLVDLTFHNPNVFYECGRRHENGKATIQLIKKGEKLPFDVAGIRTIEYDLIDPWTTLESVKNLKDFISNLENNDAYGDRHTGVSLTSISQTLNRIEKSINDIVGSRTSTNANSSKYDLLTAHPWVAFKAAFDQGNFESAKFLLSRLKVLPSKKSYLGALKLLATAGDTEAKQSLIDTGMSGSELDADDYLEIIFGLRDHYYNTDSEESGFVEMGNLIRHIEKIKDKFEDKKNGLIYNGFHMIAYNARKYEIALNYGLESVKYFTDSGSLWYNVSLCYMRLERYDDAVNAVIQFVKYEKNMEQRHLNHIQEVLEKAGKGDQLDNLLTKKRFG